MVLTIIILIILATITINFAFGENGLITQSQLAKEQYEIEQVREKLEMAKGSAFADGKGSIDPDHYFDIIEEEEIINDKEEDVVDNEDGTYDVTTNEGYIFEITLIPTKENPEDIEIDYIGKGENIKPRINEIKVKDKTTNSISVEVEGRNLEGAEYTYSYKKSSEEGEDAWIEFETSESNTCTISGLETGVVYDIKVVVTTKRGEDEDQISEITGEIKEGSITIGDIVWQGDGTAKVTVTTDITEPGCYIEYKVGADGDTWTRIESGDEITLKLNDEVYARVTDGTNTLDDAYRKISDNGNPTVNITKAGEATTNSITVNVTATDAESGMKEGTTYTYYIKESSQADTEYVAKATDVTDTSYTFTELNQNTSYDIKVEVDGDRAGNKGEDTLLNQQTKEVAGASEGLREGSIVATAPSWSNGQASITLTTDTGLQIQYQKGGITGTWTTISSGGQVTGLNHNDTVYARLWDGKNAGASASVEIRDTNDPVISNISPSNITSDSITVTVTASDGESGLATSGTYKYYLNNGSAITSTNNSYTFSGLQPETSYNIKVEVFDKAGRKGEKSITASTIAIPEVGASDINANPIGFYGEKVTGYTCSSSAVSTWRIYYADSNNIYLIADDYISKENVPNGRGGSPIEQLGNEYNLSFGDIIRNDDYPGASWIRTNSKAKNWLSQYLNSYSSSTGVGTMAVAYMLDTNVWSTYAGSYAEYAIGAPTIELFCASYQDTHPNKYIQYKVIDEDGYSVKWNTDSSYSEDRHTLQGMPQDDFNSIYVKSDYNKVTGMWIASTTHTGGPNSCFEIYYDGSVWEIGAAIASGNWGCGFRPIVCLKSSVKLEKQGDGYAIVK